MIKSLSLIGIVIFFASCNIKPEQEYIKQMGSLAEGDFRNDKLFVFEEHAGAIREIALASFVMKHSKDPEIIALGQMVKDGHQAGADKLEAIATELKIELTREPIAMDIKKIEVLGSMNSEDLTRYYLIHQQSMHAWDIAAFTNYASVAKNASLKKYIIETIAPLREHAAQVIKLSGDKGIITTE